MSLRETDQVEKRKLLEKANQILSDSIINPGGGIELLRVEIRVLIRIQDHENKTLDIWKDVDKF
jgi:hypothetical protein